MSLLQVPEKSESRRHSAVSGTHSIPEEGEQESSELDRQSDCHDDDGENTSEYNDEENPTTAAVSQQSNLVAGSKSTAKIGRSSHTTSRRRMSVAVKPGKLQLTLGAGKSRNAGGFVPTPAAPAPTPNASSRLLFNRPLSSQRQMPVIRQPAELGVIGSRPGSRVGSPTSWTAQSRPTSPSELIVAVEKVKRVAPNDSEKQKVRMIKSAGAKLAQLNPVSGAGLKPAENDQSAVKPQDFAILRARAENIATLVHAKLVASRWRAINAQKKVDVVEAAKQTSRLDLHSAPLPRQRCSDVIAPTVNGMRIFGISKGGITRAIVKFNGPPPSCPLTLCFHFPSTFLTHRYVLDMVRSKINGLVGARVTTIQFIDRNTLHGTQGLDNRWLVTMNNEAARDMLLQKGLHLFNRHILVRPYDEILMAEYSEYLEYLGMQKRMYAKMRESGGQITDSATSDLMPSDLTNASEATKVLLLPVITQGECRDCPTAI